MAQVGRISGPLLQENLERNGIDLAFETDLIYLDVNSGRIGISTNSPTNDLQNSLTTRTTNLIVDTQADFTNIINIQNSTIQPFPGSLFLDARYNITANKVKTDNLLIDDDRISTYTTDTNIELRPNGTGITEFNNLWVENDLNVTGDVTIGGDITFGNADTDSVTFDADVTSDIIPDADLTYNLGTTSKRWQTIEARLLNGQDIDAQVALIGGVDIGVRPGNLFYVSTNGDNANVGDHPQGPYRTIDYAVTQASAGDTIIVFPGEYEETCPIEVPAGVAIRGYDIRNTIVKPPTSDNYVDVFLMNGESTVTDLTVKDFYYDSGNDVGYAFRFAENATITTRSPYIQNVSVITAGSVTSASDPRGFEEGDAGKGALVDGADVLGTSEEASMLFHSVTFITPGVDALTMTNGVRVEWLNSFTYFANRGLYAVDGVTGHLSTDGSTVKYGAEMRSIGSACVYGNYGAVADGSDTLMYLIQHNMGYIGSGKYVDNDSSRVIQANEIVKLNSGEIYYQTVNHFGDFRIGENFFINAETGESSIVINESEVQGFGRLRVTATDTGNVTIIDGEQISTGSLVFTENLISSVDGDVNIASASSTIELPDNVNITGDLDITGDLTFDGSLNLLGNQTTDTLTFNVNIEQDLNPNTTLEFDLGSASKTWNNVWLSEAQIGDTQINDNYITTNISNADLELRANGTGEILVPSNNVQIDNNLTVSTATDLQSLTITGLLDQTGDRIQTSDVTLNGELTVDNVYVEDNFITTISGDLNLAATGNINVDVNDVEIANNLTVSVDTDLQDVAITGTLTQTGNLDITGDLSATNITITGDLNLGSQQQFEEVLFDGNVITTTTSNADLELRASGTGEVLVPNQDVTVTNNFDVEGSSFTQDINNAQTVTAVTLTTGDVNITSNVIDTSTSNSSLELRANGTGLLYVPTDDVQIDNNLTVSVDTDLQSTSVTGTITHVGNIDQTGNRTQTGHLTIDGDVAFDRRLDFEDVSIDGNVITTNLSNSDLELRASGTGVVLIDKRVDVANNFTAGTINVNDIIIDSDLVLDELAITDSNVTINDNYITTETSNADLELYASGTGNVLVPSNDVVIQQNLTVNGNTDLENTVMGPLIHVGDRTLDGNFILNGNVEVGGEFLIGGEEFSLGNIELDGNFEDITFEDNFITTRTNGSDLILRSANSDKVIFNDSLYQPNNIFANDLFANNININNSVSLEILDNSNINIFDNVITTTDSNSDLELRASGTGLVYLQELGVDQNTLSTVRTSITITSGNIDVIADAALQLPVGNIAERVAALPDSTVDGGIASETLITVYDGGDAFTVFGVNDLTINGGFAFVPDGNPGDVRFNSELGTFEGFSQSEQHFGGVYSQDARTTITANTVNQLVFNVNNIQVGLIDSEVSFTGLDIDAVSMRNNLITTTDNNDLQLTANGTGDIVIGDLTLQDSNFLNASTNGLVFSSTGIGYSKISNTGGGYVIPYGDESNKGSNSQIGEIRWNTALEIQEVYNGTEWIPARGIVDNITAEEFDDLLLEYTIILG